MATAGWLQYGRKEEFEINGWYATIVSATICAPHPWQGRTIWRFSLSRSPTFRGLWMDKNPLGRKFETRHFVSRSEARQAAEKDANE